MRKHPPVDYVLIFLMTLPSLVWILTNRSLWLSDAALYGLYSLHVNYALGLGVGEWWQQMLFVAPKPPLLPWLGQFFIPIGRAIGSIDSGLLLVPFLAQYLALVATYLTHQEYFQRRSVALAGCLAIASTPIFITGSQQFFSQPLQLAAVSWFVYIMAKAHKWHAGYTSLHLIAAGTCAMLAILSSPIFAILPVSVALLQMWKDPASGPRWSVRHTILLGLVLAALCAAGFWYAQNWENALSYADFAYRYRVHGIPDGFIIKLLVWARLAFDQFHGSALLVVAALVVLIGGIAGLWHLRPAPSALPTWQIVAIVAQIALVFVVLSSSSQQNDRYMLALSPYVALLIAWLVFQTRWPLGRVAIIGVLLVQLAASHVEKFGAREQQLSRLSPVGLRAGAGRERAIIEAIVTVTSRDPAGSVVLATGLLGFFNSEVQYEAAKHRAQLAQYFSGKHRRWESLEFMLVGSSVVGEVQRGPEQVWNDIQAQAGFVVVVSREMRDAVRNQWRGSVGEIARTWLELLESASDLSERVEASEVFEAVDLPEYPEITIYARVPGR